jgi:cytochrome P450
MLRPHFFKSHISSVALYERNFQSFLALLPSDESTSIDLQPLLAQLSFDAVTELLLGESVRTLDGDPSTPASKFAGAFDYVRVRLMYLAPLHHYLRKVWYDPGLDEAGKTAHAYVGRLVDEAVMRRNKRLAAGEPRCEEEESAVDFLLNATDDLDRVRNELLSLFFAGRDPIADFTSNLFFVLSRHPEVWQKIRQEAGGIKSQITYETLMGCIYIRNSINEGKIFSQPAY